MNEKVGLHNELLSLYVVISDENLFQFKEKLGCKE
jgi:hypothetical protein